MELYIRNSNFGNIFDEVGVCIGYIWLSISVLIIIKLFYANFLT